jgi:hypothetical protein
MSDEKLEGDRKVQVDQKIVSIKRRYQSNILCEVAPEAHASTSSVKQGVTSGFTCLFPVGVLYQKYNKLSVLFQMVLFLFI